MGGIIKPSKQLDCKRSQGAEKMGGSGGGSMCLACGSKNLNYPNISVRLDLVFLFLKGLRSMTQRGQRGQLSLGEEIF